MADTEPNMSVAASHSDLSASLKQTPKKLLEIYQDVMSKSPQEKQDYANKQQHGARNVRLELFLSVSLSLTHKSHNVTKLSTLSLLFTFS